MGVDKISWHIGGTQEPWATKFWFDRKLLQKDPRAIAKIIGEKDFILDDLIIDLVPGSEENDIAREHFAQFLEGLAANHAVKRLTVSGLVSPFDKKLFSALAKTGIERLSIEGEFELGVSVLQDMLPMWRLKFLDLRKISGYTLSPDARQRILAAGEKSGCKIELPDEPRSSENKK